MANGDFISGKYHKKLGGVYTRKSFDKTIVQSLPSIKHKETEAQAKNSANFSKVIRFAVYFIHNFSKFIPSNTKNMTKTNEYTKFFYKLVQDGTFSLSNITEVLPVLKFFEIKNLVIDNETKKITGNIFQATPIFAGTDAMAFIFCFNNLNEILGSCVVNAKNTNFEINSTVGIDSPSKVCAIITATKAHRRVFVQSIIAEQKSALIANETLMCKNFNFAADFSIANETLFSTQKVFQNITNETCFINN